MEVIPNRMATKEDLTNLEVKTEKKLDELIECTEKMSQTIRHLDKQDEYLKQNIQVLSQKMDNMQEQFDSLRALINKIVIVQSKSN